jgi:hypothetical protein
LLAPFLRTLEQEILAPRRLRSTAPPMHAITLHTPKIVLMICVKASREGCEDVSNLQVICQNIVRFALVETRRRARENACDVWQQRCRVTLLLDDYRWKSATAASKSSKR